MIRSRSGSSLLQSLETTFRESYLCRRYASRKADPTYDHSWPIKVHRLVESLSPPSPLSKRDEDDLVGVLRDVLDSKMMNKSSNKPIRNHFRDLFNGLQRLTDSKTQSLVDLPDHSKIRSINKLASENEVLAAFDDLYYHGELSRKVASTILRHRSVENVDHIVKLVLGGGTGLHRWSAVDKYTLRLQLANKYWALDRREKSAALTIDCFETIWAQVLTTRVLDAFALAGLVRAVLAFKRQDLFLSLFNSWDESTFSLQDNSPSEVLSSLFIPLCKAAAVAGNYELAASAINCGIRCTRCEQMEEPVVLFAVVLDILLRESSPESLIILKSLDLQSLQLPTSDQSAVNAVGHLIDLSSSLAAAGHERLVHQVFPLFEVFISSRACDAVLTAKFSLLRLNLSSSKDHEEYDAGRMVSMHVH
jgi:hypothetical protein